MTYIPDPDPTPLRLRLGHHAESFWQAPVEETPTESPLPAEANEFIQMEVGAPAESIPAAETPSPAPWSERLDRAIAQTDERVERWVVDQQRRLVAGLDLMLAQLKEQRREEAAHLEAWKIAERRRVERELAGEEEHFRARLMAELTAFEEQLALRLCEQEERLARWWDEAEQLAQQRFAELGRSATADAAQPPTT